MNRHRPIAHPHPRAPVPMHFIDPALVAKANALKETLWLRIGTMQADFGDHERALNAFEQCLRINASNLHALTQLGAVLAKKGRYVVAIGHLQRAIGINASCGEAWAVLGHCHVMKDDLPNAYEAYQNALNHLRNPSDPNLWYGIALLYDRYGSLENALEAFLAVLRIAPQFERYTEVCFCIGVIYKEQRKYDQALAYFDQVRVSLDPPIPPLTRADGWYQIGHVNELKKDIPKALEMYKRALSENPRHAKTLQNFGWLEHSKLDNSRQAIGRLQRALEADQNDAQTWYLLGRVHMALQEYKQAYDAYQQAVYRDGRNSTYWCSIGVLYSQMNQFRDAMDAYARAIRLNQNVSEVWFDLGTLYERTGQTADAISAYARANELAIDKDRAHIRERLNLLQSNRGNGNGNHSRQALSLPMNISNLQRSQPQLHQQLPPMRTQNPHPSLPKQVMRLPASSAQRTQAPPYSHLRTSMPLLSSVPAHRRDPRQQPSIHNNNTNFLSQPLPKLPPRKPVSTHPIPTSDGARNTQPARLPLFRMNSLGQRGMPGTSSSMDINTIDKPPMNCVPARTRDEKEAANGLKDANLLLSTSTPNQCPPPKKHNSTEPTVSSAPTVSSSSGSVNVNITIPALPLPGLRSAPAPAPKKDNDNDNGNGNGNTSAITPRFGMSSLSNFARSATAPKVPATLPSPLVHAATPTPLKSPPPARENSSSPRVPMCDKNIPKAKSPTVEQTSNGVIINIPRSVPISSLTGDKTSSPSGRNNLTPSKRGPEADDKDEDKIAKRPRVHEEEKENEDSNSNENRANGKTVIGNNTRKEDATLVAKHATGDDRIVKSVTATAEPGH